MAQLVEALSYKVAGSIPDGVIGLFHWHNSSGRTLALGPTQPLTKMSTSPGGKGGRCVILTTLPPSCAICLEILEPQPPGTLQGLSRPVMGLVYTFFLFVIVIFNLYSNITLFQVRQIVSPFKRVNYFYFWISYANVAPCWCFTRNAMVFALIVDIFTLKVLAIALRHVKFRVIY